MKAQIVPIGNSKGIRIPKALLEECGLEGSVTLTVKDHTLIISAYHEKPRTGWDLLAKEMTQRGDDVLIDEPIKNNSWDETEWEW